MPEEPKTLADQLRAIDDCEPTRCDRCGALGAVCGCRDEDYYFDETLYRAGK